MSKNILLKSFPYSREFDKLIHWNGEFSGLEHLLVFSSKFRKRARTPRCRQNRRSWVREQRPLSTFGWKRWPQPRLPGRKVPRRGNASFLTRDSWPISKHTPSPTATSTTSSKRTNKIVGVLGFTEVGRFHDYFDQHSKFGSISFLCYAGDIPRDIEECKVVGQITWMKEPYNYQQCIDRSTHNF